MTMHPDFVSVFGLVLSTWGYYEGMLEMHIEFLSAVLTPVEREKPTRRGFTQRTKLFRDLAARAFHDAPSIRNHINKLADRADSLGDERNILCHGSWIPGGPKSPFILFRRKNQSFIYTVEIDHLHQIQKDIVSLYERQFDLLTFAVYFDADSVTWITSQEKSILQLFHKNNPPIPPSAKLPKPQHLPFRA